MSENSPLTSGDPSVPSPVPPSSSQAPAAGRLRISLRGKAVTPTGMPAPAQSSPRSANSETPINSAPSTLQSPQPAPPAIVINEPLPQQPQPVADKDRDLQWRAESLLQQILAPKAPAFEFVPSLASSQGLASVKVRGSEEIVTQGPMTQQEALLMVSALKVLGKADYAKLLLPPSLSSASFQAQDSQSFPNDPSAQPSIPQSDVERMDVSHDASSASAHLHSASIPHNSSSIDNSQHISSLSSPIPLSTEELNIIYASAQSAQQGARAASRKWEEDDESLALELELEFTQLDPITRVELLKQLDAAEREQFTTSGARSERLSRAAKEAAFHNAQMTVDRSRLGPYYYDPHTRTHQSYHAIAIQGAEVEATILDESNPKITVINPELPLPHNFEYFPNQPGDLNVALRKGRNTGGEGAVEANYAVNSALQPSMPNLDGAMSVIQKVKRNTIRYAVMDGYAQWLKAEIANHKSASAPLDPYTSWTQQFHAQWDVLQPQGCFDFILNDQGAVGAQKSTTLLSSMSTSSNGGTSDVNGQKAGAKVSTSVRNVWKAHRKHLEAEHAVMLAMEGAERARRRAKFGDPEDKDIDPGKPLTRDERRKLQKREKEHHKMKLFFLREKKRIFGENYTQLAKKFLFSVSDSLTSSSSSILNNNASSGANADLSSSIPLRSSTNGTDPNYLHLLLHQLSWYDLSTLYLSLGFSMAQLQDDDHPKAESEKPRSHKKGAAKAAKLAAKKLEAASAAASSPSPSPMAPSAHGTTLSHASQAAAPSSSGVSGKRLYSSSSSSAASPASPAASSSKKRSRVINVEDDSVEEEAYRSSSASKETLYGGVGFGLVGSGLVGSGLVGTTTSQLVGSFPPSSLPPSSALPPSSLPPSSALSTATPQARPFLAPSPMSLYPMSPSSPSAGFASTASSPSPLSSAALGGSSSPAPAPNLSSRGLAQCAECGAMDEATELVRCNRCRAPYHSYCLDDQDINFQSWTCHRCAN